MNANEYSIPKSPRIDRLIDTLFEKIPAIESTRAVLLTESFRSTEGEPTVLRRAKAFAHILRNIPIVIRDEELIVGSTTLAPRGCFTFPEYSYTWLESEFDTVATRDADPFRITEQTKEELHRADAYWSGRSESDYALSLMREETKRAIAHNIFTVGNYFYNGVGHVTVHYDWIVRDGFRGILERVSAARAKLTGGADDASRRDFLDAVEICANAAIDYAHRYADLAAEMAEKATGARRDELLVIAHNCSRVPEHGATSFWEACQSFWFVQQLIQIESSGHSVSPGRFDQYMFPFYDADLKAGKITESVAQELLDCVWVKLNDLGKCRDEESAEGFAGYSMFQNLVVGGQNTIGLDATNALSYMCIEASLHTHLPQPSLSIRVWNGSPQKLMLRAATLTRTGIGLPAYYNDEVIIPALMNRGLTMEDARDYNLIGCVEPQKGGKTEGWHDSAFFNMCRVLELTLAGGVENGEQVGLPLGDATTFTTYEQFVDAYRKQTEYFVSLMVDADNSVDRAHAKLCPLPFMSGMIEDCIARGKSSQEGGAVYNFTGPQGVGIANVADSLIAIKTLVYDEKKLSLSDFVAALRDNYGKAPDGHYVDKLAKSITRKLAAEGRTPDKDTVRAIVKQSLTPVVSAEKQAKYDKLLALIEALPKFGNDIPEVDYMAREFEYFYARAVEQYTNPRGGRYQAGLYPVSANVPLGQQTGATPDGRLAHSPVADGVSPSAGRDVQGPTAAATSVARLDHFICSNGTLFNQKFHPAVLAGERGLNNFVSLIRTFFDQKGSHIQFNVVSRETLLDAQKHPENYQSLVVRVAGYSARFTTLSRALQDDIINRTEQSEL